MLTYVTIATQSPHRYFDLDAVRGPGSPNTHARLAKGVESRPTTGKKAENPGNNYGSMNEIETTGAPPLDWHTDLDGDDWLWNTEPWDTPTTDTDTTQPTEGHTGMGLEYRIGDVFERLAEIPDGSIDLIVTSPPFLALRSYLPSDHPDKGKEIGSEATPAAFIDTLLALTAEWGRVLAPHGSLCVELGDTFSGGGVGWDTDDAKWANRDGFRTKTAKLGAGWPLAKSLTGIPTLYPWSLAYGRNLLTGQPSPAGQWRIRNVIVWARPNPPVGALGDKFRPATSYITVACRGAKRYFDLDAVRLEQSPNSHARLAAGVESRPNTLKTSPDGNRDTLAIIETNGAPPLDWHTDHHPEDGDWLWKLSTQPYAGSHYATFPMALPKRLIEAMCPLRVCTICGRPSERITSVEFEPHGQRNPNEPRLVNADALTNPSAQGMEHGRATKHVETLGWSDCGHNTWRAGIVLDPFAGSGTTLEAAQAVGRHAIGIDLDSRNGDLARERVGMFMEIQEGAA